jgi:hypothetical protein
VTDTELVAKKLALIETCVEQLRRLARPAAIASDVREERFVEHTLKIAIQAALDVASHIVSGERLGERGPEQRLRAAVRFHILFHAHRRGEAFLSHSELRSLTPGNLRRIIAKRDRYEQIFRDVLAEGVDTDVFDVSDIKLAVIAILTMCTSVATWFSEAGRLDASEIVDCYTEMILRAVAAVSPAQLAPPGGLLTLAAGPAVPGARP